VNLWLSAHGKWPTSPTRLEATILFIWENTTPWADEALAAPCRALAHRMVSTIRDREGFLVARSGHPGPSRAFNFHSRSGREHASRGRARVDEGRPVGGHVSWSG
jgi:hypothetical protein